MANDIADVRIWMKHKYIVVPDDWLEACLHWVMEVHQDDYLSPSRIKECVYEQWLIADLREVGSRCLPDSVLTSQKNILQGIHTLQMLDIRDISQPSYSQLSKLRGKDNQNSIISAEPQPSLQPWEAKPKRMLMMTLTDGNLCLNAMEYKPIPMLHLASPPGIKIQVCGPIDCRLGTLLLTAEKIRILGGEVESLVNENSNERMLLRVLGQDDDSSGGRRNQRRRDTSLSIDSGIFVNESNDNLQQSHNTRDSITLPHQRTVNVTSDNSSSLQRTINQVHASHLSNNVIDLTISQEMETFPDSTCESDMIDGFEDDDEFLTNLDYDHLDQLVQECSGSTADGQNRRETAVSRKIRTPPPTLEISNWDFDCDNFT